MARPEGPDKPFDQGDEPPAPPRRRPPPRTPVVDPSQGLVFGGATPQDPTGRGYGNNFVNMQNYLAANVGSATGSTPLDTGANYTPGQAAMDRGIGAFGGAYREGSAPGGTKTPLEGGRDRGNQPVPTTPAPMGGEAPASGGNLRRPPYDTGQQVDAQGFEQPDFTQPNPQAYGIGNFDAMGQEMASPKKKQNQGAGGL